MLLMSEMLPWVRCPPFLAATLGPLPLPALAHASMNSTPPAKKAV